MSRHRGAKPDRRYGLLDPIHIVPHFHGVQTISSPCQRQGPDVLPWPWIEPAGSASSGPKSCRAKPLYAGNRRNVFRRGTVVTDRALPRNPRYCPPSSTTCVAARPQRVCVSTKKCRVSPFKVQFVSLTDCSMRGLFFS